MYLSSYGAIISTFWVKPCSNRLMSADRIQQGLEEKEYDLTKQDFSLVGFVFSSPVVLLYTSKLYSVSFYCYIYLLDVRGVGGRGVYTVV